MTRSIRFSRAVGGTVAALLLVVLGAPTALAGPREQARRLHDRLVGTPPDPGVRVEGCRFRPRCSFAVDACGKNVPTLEFDSDGHGAACFNTTAVRSATSGACA